MNINTNFTKSFCGKCLQILSNAFMMLAIIALGVGNNPQIAFSKEGTALEKLKEEAVNFHEVVPGIYRSGLIPEKAAPLLREAGIKTVISFDDDRERAAAEEERLKHLGIEVIPMPWSGWEYPKDETIQKAISLIENPELRPVLVHCKHGQERTGVVVACWRISHKGWSADQAYQEMKSYGFRTFQYGHLKKYVYDFAWAHGDQKAKIPNLWERMKTNLLNFFYQFRKANVFGAAV